MNDIYRVGMAKPEDIPSADYVDRYGEGNYKEEDLKKLTLTPIKAELRAIKFSSVGNKAVLIERLMYARQTAAKSPETSQERRARLDKQHNDKVDASFKKTNDDKDAQKNARLEATKVSQSLPDGTQQEYYKIIGYQNNIPVDFYKKYPGTFYTLIQLKKLKDSSLVIIASKASKITLLEKESYKEPFLVEYYGTLLSEISRRNKLYESQSPESSRVADMTHSMEIIEASIAQIQKLPEDKKASYSDSQMKSQIEVPDIVAKNQATELKVQQALELDIDGEKITADKYKDFLEVASPGDIKKEIDEIDEALKMLRDAQRDKIMRAEDVNTQRNRLNTLRNRLENPEFYKELAYGQEPDYSKGNTYNVGSQGVLQTNRGEPIDRAKTKFSEDGSVRKTNADGSDFDVFRKGRTINVVKRKQPTPGKPVPPPVQRTGPSDEPIEDIQATPIRPKPEQAQETGTGTNPLVLEAQEYIRKIGEIPINQAPTILLEIRTQLEAGVASNDSVQLQKALKKARDYFTKLDSDMNAIPDTKQTAGRAIDSSLEDMKKIQAQNKLAREKKTALEELRPSGEKGEEERIKKDFNKDVLQLSNANEILKSKVEIQREEIKQLKESIEVKRKKENDDMMSGIAPVFRHLLSLDIENVVKDEEEQVYYTVI